MAFSRTLLEARNLDAVVFDTETVWTLEAHEATIFIVDIFFGTPPIL